MAGTQEKNQEQEDKEKDKDKDKGRKNKNKNKMLNSKPQKNNAQEDQITKDFKDTKIDLRTGKNYKDLYTKCEEFEETLVDTNLDLILGIIKGDLTKKSGALNQVQSALVGLHYLSKFPQKDKNKLKEYCNALIPFLESNMPKLEELVKLFAFKECKYIL